jgi:EAL domain-containing protein (putative c-di-GMP-specific phosphodiesterase class I)
MYTLAEGIELIEQKELLEEYGCDLFQGYYFSKPLKIEQMKEYLGVQ